MNSEKRILIKGGTILSLDESIGTLPKGDVLIEGTRIKQVAPSITDDTAEVIDATNKIVAPGMVDTHRHVWLSTLRGKSVDWTLAEYMTLARVMYCACYDEEDAYLANYVGGLEAVASGITTLVDHSHLQVSPAISDALAKGLIDSGVGGFFCYALLFIPEHPDLINLTVEQLKEKMFSPTPEWIFENAARIRDKYFADPNQPLRFGVAVNEFAAYSPSNVAAKLFERAYELKPELITGHWDGKYHEGKYCSPTSDLVKAGHLKEKVVLSHCNHLSKEDIELLASKGVGISTTPNTEIGMGMGKMLAYPYLKMGGKPSLGVDTCTGGGVDMFTQVRLLLQVQRMQETEAVGKMTKKIPIEAKTILPLAMQKGAESLGIGEEVGSLTSGKRADIILVDTDNIFNWPIEDPVGVLSLYSTPHDVDTVLVAGKVLKRNKELVGVNWKELQAKVKASYDRIEARFAKLNREKLEGVWGNMFG
jgi:5-methylthioadenosine/S-adenosylhomocysteine deaminase